MIFFSIAYNIRMPTKKIYTNTLAQIAGKVMTGLISIFLIKIVADYLAARGLDKSRIRTKGYGGTKPIYVNPATEKERALNRRVEIKAR